MMWLHFQIANICLKKIESSAEPREQNQFGDLLKCAPFKTRQTKGFHLAENCKARDGWHRRVKVQRRRWRNHNRRQQSIGGRGCSRRHGLPLPTAKPPEETPRRCAAGRDALRIAESR